MYMKPTPDQITQHFSNLQEIEHLLKECSVFMESHLPNAEQLKVHADLQRLPKKIEAVRLAFITLLRGQV